jgi:hypothetical protein
MNTKILPYVFAVILTVGTVYFVFAQDPEEILAISADGALTISGRVRADRIPVVLPAPEDTSDTIKAYNILVKGMYFESPMKIHLQQEGACLLRKNGQTNTWEFSDRTIVTSGVYGVKQGGEDICYTNDI